MSHFNTGFAEYVQNFPKTINSTDLGLYRTLGALDAAADDEILRSIQNNLFTLAEVWSLLRLENPDVTLAHLTPAGRHFSGYDYKRFTFSERLREAVQLAVSETLQYAPAATIAKKLYALLTGKSDSMIDFRQSDLWIGGAIKEDAAYVAPDATEIDTRLEETLQVLRQEKTVPPLQLLGIAHSYSFLLLPFQEENMKWTALWSLFLSRHLRVPNNLFLPLSYGLFSVRDTYSQGLLSSASTSKENWNKVWESSLSITTEASLRILHLSKTFWNTLQHGEDIFGKAKKHLVPLIMHLTLFPYVTLRDICEITGLTKPNASILIQKAEKIGLLSVATYDKRNRVYVCENLVQILTGK